MSEIETSYTLNPKDGSIEDDSMPKGPNDPEAAIQAARVAADIDAFEKPAAGTKPETDDLEQL